MPNGQNGNGATMMATRRMLLAGSAGLALITGPARATEIAVGLTLTPGADVIVVSGLDTALQKLPDFWGLTPPILSLGVDALGGADSIIFDGKNKVAASADSFRIYTSFPVDPSTIADILEPPSIAARAVGADGGSGADSIAVAKQLGVEARGLFVQADLDIGATIPAGYVFALDATLDVDAQGLAGGLGNDILTNGGTLTTLADAEAGRGELAITAATFGDIPQNLTSTARATGFDGGFGDDRIINEAGAALLVTADSLAVTAAITLTGVTIASPANATVGIADALGFSGGDGSDRLLNAGLATISSKAEIIEADITASGTTIGITEYILPDTTQDTQAEARARGMTGGAGPDQLENDGSLILAAEAVYGVGGLFIGDASIDTTAIDVLIDPPAIPDEPAAGAVARVVGMDGDDGDAVAGFSDILTNRKVITGVADATSAALDIFVALPINSITGVGGTAVGDVLSAFSLSLTDVSADSAAYATGMTGGSFRDIITQAGSLAMTANATSLVGQIGVDFSTLIPSSDEEESGGGLPFSLGLGVSSVGANAYAQAKGVEGGTGTDVISSSATSKTTTGASAEAKMLDVNLVLANSDDTNVKLNGSAFFARSWAAADAVGFDGGADEDQFSLLGTTSTSANALAQSLSVGLTISVGKSGATVNASYADADILSEASAAALRAADAQDRVVIGGTHTTLAAADIEAISVAANFQVTSEKGFAGAAAFISADQQASAVAVGVDRSGPVAPTPEPGAPFVWPIGRSDILSGTVLNTTAAADASRIGVSAQVGGSAKGFALGAAATEVAQSADAKARGFAGSDDADALNAPSLFILTTASADAFSTATSLGVGVADAGVGAGLGLVLASTEAVADAAGIALGAGNDVATLGGQVSSFATAVNWNNGNALELAGANNGVALGAALAFMETAAEARARAVDLGIGNDSLISSATLGSNAIADSKVDMFSIALSGAVNGVGGSVSFAQTGGSAQADSVAADLGAGADSLLQTANVSATAGATIETQAAGIALGANYQGVGAGVGLIDLAGDALARAVGADGGDGDDAITVLADIDSTAGADADSLEITVGLGITIYGVGAGGAALLSDIGSVALGAGLAGGLGNDQLYVSGGVTSEATARANRLGVTIGGGGGIVAFSATFVEAAARSSALATGLAGDRFDVSTLLGLPLPGGNDWLESAGDITARSVAETEGTDVAVSIAVGIGGSANLLEAAASSQAVATGQDGGGGNDTLIARGAVDVEAEATTEALSVQVALVGANLGDVSTNATARATGLGGGDGSDRIEAYGEIDSSATATTDTTAAGFVFTGASIGDMATRASAQAMGVDGGAGNDVILTRKLVGAKASASAPLETIQIALTGGAVADAESSAVATATGIAGGDGDNVVDIGDAVFANSTAAISAKSIGVNVTGLSQSDVTATARSVATAVAAGGAGGVAGVIAGGLTATSFATGGINALSVTLLGVGDTVAGAGAESTATGIAGGGGKDGLTLLGASTILAQGTSSMGGTAVTLTGLQLSRPQGSATVVAGLADLGTGNDSLVVRGQAVVTAIATASADTGTYTLIGGALAIQGADAQAEANAASGGDGDDFLILDAPVSVTATGLATARNQSVTILGGSVAAARGKAVGIATGLDGGEGNDWLENRGSLVLRGTGSASFAGTVGNFLGVGTVRSRLEQEGRLIGLAGGAGADNLRNAGLIDGLASASASAQAMNVTLLGKGTVRAGSLILASATGMDGGAGKDGIVNSGRVELRANASGTQSSMSIGLIGEAFESADSLVLAEVIGVSGGNEDDSLDNAGTLDLGATAAGRSSSVTGTGIGQAGASVDSIGRANLVGMDGGAGADMITTRGSLVLSAAATGAAGNLGVTLLGATPVSARQIGEVLITGLSGGLGADRIRIDGLVSLDGFASLTSVLRSYSVFGAASSGAGQRAIATLTVADGGDDADIIEMQASSQVLAEADAELSSISSSFSILGTATADGVGRSAVRVVGLSGGGGDDSLLAQGSMTLSGRALASGAASGFNVIGSSSPGGNFAARSEVIGLDGGSGSNLVKSLGRVGVSALADTQFGSSSFSAIGAATGTTAIVAEAIGRGLFAGVGASTASVAPGSEVLVDAVSSILLSSGAQVGLGTARGTAGAASLATAIGIEGGTGADTLFSEGSLAVTATSTAAFNSSRFAFAGGAGGLDAIRVAPRALGIFAGGGNNNVALAGTSIVTAIAEANGSAAAGATLGTTDAAARLSGTLNAAAVETGSGLDTVRFSGNADVRLHGVLTSSVSVSDFALFSSGIARADAIGRFEGSGLRDSGGDTVVETLAGSRLTVTAGRLEDVRSITRALGFSQGASGSVDVSAASVTSATLAGRAVGIDLGAATQTIILRGTIDVEFDGIAEAQGTANGRAAIAGEGFANTTAIASNLFAAGVFSPGAKGGIENFGTIDVRAAPTARTASNGRAEGLSGFDPDATAFTLASAINVEALGIAHGAGTIINRGSITATSAPSADKARAFSERAGPTSFAIDAISIASAVVDGARAFGIRSYESDSTIINAAGATISALSVPVSVAEAIAFGAAGTSAGDGDADALATASARNALAVGIETDKGNHRIENDGTIVAIAAPFASATATAVKAGTGEQSASQSIDITGAAAFGIRTLSGNNLVINRGTINVSAGHAIQTGGGNDEVQLLGGFTWGRIVLGAGADRLVIANSPSILGNIEGGSGTDAIEVTGAATLNGAHSGFDSLRKLGAGQFDLGLTAWNPAGTTRIEEGTVRINGGLALNGQQLETVIRPDGTNGALVVRPIGVFLPRGTIVVEKGAGVYVNGTNWDVVQTTDGLNLVQLTGGVKLPTATALVSFTSSIFDARRLRVRANVAQMSGMVTNPLERSMASALDALTPVATGSVASAILGLQQLGDVDQVRAGVAALTPQLPALALTAAQDMTDGAMALVGSRTSSLGMVAAPGFGTFSLLSSGPVAGQTGAWAANFDGTVRSAGAGLGERQGMVSGFDRQAGDGFALGFAVAHRRGIHQLAGAAGSGVLESGLFAAYGRYDGGQGLRAGLAFGAGSSGFEGGRLVPGAALSGRIDGRMQSLAADMSVERDLGSGNFAPALVGRMAWRDTRGLDVAEAGGGGLAVQLEDGRDTRLETGLGLAIAPGFDLGFHRLTTRVSAQWVHQLAGTGPTVSARFADMPDNPFLLSGGGRARDALAVDAGLSLALEGGAVLSAAVSAVPGDAMREQVARVGFLLPLGGRPDRGIFGR